MGYAGRPTVGIGLSEDERNVASMDASALFVAGFGAAVTDRAGLRGGQV